MSYQSFKRFLIGRPLETYRLAEERLPKRYALAVFSPDALSSNAYATEEILIVLVLAGAGALPLSLPIAIAIVALLAIIVISYRQLILAYPSGGGAYIVSRENLGEFPSLLAGASLLIDYSLTVAVSISAGIAAIISAFPELIPFTVELALVALVLITIANLRGVRESGEIFAIPTYAFVFGIGLTIIVGLFKICTGQSIPTSPPAVKAIEPLTLFLILRAFASGCSALTGVEAISNGVQSFKKPAAENARITLVIMALILGTLFLGITYLARAYQVIPGAETVLSQITRLTFGRGAFYFYIQITTMLILTVAANTSFAGFPNLASVMANDGYMPRQLKARGYRLAYSNGILLLALFAAILIVVFHASVNRLIPLYAVGVFTGFTLSQFGMVKHWHNLRSQDSHWWHNALVNGIGGIATLIVTLVLAIAKFIQGAWIVIVLALILVLIFRGVHRHYQSVASQLTLERLTEVPKIKHNVVVLISSVHVGTVEALQYAKSLNPTVIRAVHIDIDSDQTEKVRQRWEKFNFGVPLEIIDSPYRDIASPFLQRLREIEAEMSDDIVTVIIPEFVVSHWWENFLHNQTALVLKGLLFFSRDVVVISIPYHLR
ncbi:MAG TPA: APC family permease [Candidatus Aquicultor sp.]|jgi:amino acid transporter